MDLTDASAIVTGGAATVRRLAQKGAKVVIVDASDERVAAEGCDALVATGVTPAGRWL